MALYIFAIALIIVDLILIGIGCYIIGGDIIREHKNKKFYKRWK